MTPNILFGGVATKFFVTQPNCINKTKTEMNGAQYASICVTFYAKKLGFCVNHLSFVD